MTRTRSGGLATCFIVTVMLAGCASPVNRSFGAYMASIVPGSGATTEAFDGKHYRLDKSPVITAHGVKSVTFGIDPNINLPEIKFVLKPDAASALEAASQAHIGDPMCLKVDGHIVSCAMIQGVIGKKFVTTFPDAATARKQYQEITGKP